MSLGESVSGERSLAKSLATLFFPNADDGGLLMLRGGISRKTVTRDRDACRHAQCMPAHTQTVSRSPSMHAFRVRAYAPARAIAAPVLPPPT